MNRCSTCDQWLYSARAHRCPPSWLVWCPEDGETFEDAARIWASDAEEAAAEFVESSESNACEYPCLGGGESWVHVVPGRITADELAQATVLLFCVTGESVPSYSARLKEPREGVAVCRVSNRQQADDGWWTIHLENLRGEHVGGFTFRDAMAPAPRSYVDVEGALGVECTFRWRDDSHRKHVLTAEGFSP